MVAAAAAAWSAAALTGVTVEFGHVVHHRFVLLGGDGDFYLLNIIIWKNTRVVGIHTFGMALFSPAFRAPTLYFRCVVDRIGGFV